jgi:hypothetical protein
MSEQVRVTEGDTKVLIFNIKRSLTPEATPTTFDASGLTLTATITAKDRATSVTTTGGKTTWVDQANSQAGFKPAALDFLKSKSPYYLHFTLTDGTGDQETWPEGGGIELVVAKRGEG